MSERLSAKPTGPVFIIGVARRILIRVADGELVTRVEIVINLKVDLLAAVAIQSGNGWADGKNVFAAAALVSGPSKRSRIQSVAKLVVVGHWHLVHELRHESRRIDACPVLIP